MNYRVLCAMTALCLLVLIPQIGHSQGKSPEPLPHTPTLSADAAAQSFSAALSKSVAVSRSESVSGVISKNEAVSGDSTASATTGAIENNNTSAGGESVASTGDVTVSTRHRKAPVNTAYAGTGMNTADMLVCFSLGGQSREGAASGIKCWLQRDLYANYRAALHAEAGRFEASAKASCSKPLFSGDFDSVEDCEASVYQSLVDQTLPDMTAEQYEQMLEDQREQYEEKLTRLEEAFNESIGLSVKK